MKELLALLTKETADENLVPISYKDYQDLLFDTSKATPLDHELREIYLKDVKKYVKEILLLRIIKAIQGKNIPQTSFDYNVLKEITRLMKVYEKIVKGDVLVDGKGRVIVKVLKDFNVDPEISKKTHIPKKLTRGDIIIVPLNIALSLMTLEVVEL